MDEKTRGQMEHYVRLVSSRLSGSRPGELRRDVPVRPDTEQPLWDTDGGCFPRDVREHTFVLSVNESRPRVLYGCMHKERSQKFTVPLQAL